MNLGVSYNMFYEILLNLREYFHSYGRIDDSNAKLDEIVKLITISFSLAKKGIKFDISYVRKVAKRITGNSNSVAKGLIKIFEDEVKDKAFINNDGTNIFGAKASMGIQDIENEFAEKIITEIEKIDFVNLIEKQKYSDFDIINECFGHFIRENFRNNKEDAQYMTPYEISTPVLDIIFNDMINEKYLNNKNYKNFKIMDATCGVGTLLIEASNYYTRFIEKIISSDKERKNVIDNFRKNGMIGQDKVERMVRLSKINTLLMGGNISNINIGNSIVGKSSISKYKNKVNLIFTNPPFGAEYKKEDLVLSDYPILKKLDINLNSITSELLMLDKCIDMLDEGGYLAIVLPDSVFASKGIESQYRDEILKNYSVKGVIELPSVTFAQAGTRTNTCILYMKKEISLNNDSIKMMICKDLGYVVKEKAGVPVKVLSGNNEMPIIADAIKKDSKNKILSMNPSITSISSIDLNGNILKPSFYAAEKYEAIDSINKVNKKDYKVGKITDVVDFVTTSRKAYMVSDEIKHISVLHVNSNCTINFNEVNIFNPVCKGRECRKGDLLFSKINPRIPRMTVVPNYEHRTVCSNEFEIMVPKTDLSIYTICYLLRSKNVITQIESMTSGTSSSHSRIKREQLAEIKIPIPINAKSIKTFNEIGEQLRKATEGIYKAENIIRNETDKITSLSS